MHVGHAAATWGLVGWASAFHESGPVLRLAVAAVAVAYTFGVCRLWRDAGTGRGVRRWQAWCYAGGIFSLGFALVSPLDPMSAELFAAHMVQHMLLVAVAPPLLVLGLPGVALAWALPRRVRRRLVTWWRDAPRLRRRLRETGRVLTRPAVVWLPHALVLWMWHTPRAYDAAVTNPIVHALEHTTFLVTGVMLWWAVIRPSGPRRAGYGAGVLVLGVTMMQTGVLGALLAFSSTAWYGAHVATTAHWGLTPLDDQQLAGTIMWVPGGVLYLIAMAVLFRAWISALPEKTSFAVYPPSSYIA